MATTRKQRPDRPDEAECCQEQGGSYDARRPTWSLHEEESPEAKATDPTNPVWHAQKKILPPGTEQQQRDANNVATIGPTRFRMSAYAAVTATR